MKETKMTQPNKQRKEPQEDWEKRLKRTLDHYMPNEGIRNLIMFELRTHKQKWEEEERDEILEIIEKAMGEWPEPQSGAGEGLGPLAGTGMYMQYDADRKKRRQEIQELKSLILSRQKDEPTL